MSTDHLPSLITGGIVLALCFAVAACVLFYTAAITLDDWAGLVRVQWIGGLLIAGVVISLAGSVMLYIYKTTRGL